MSNPTDEPLYLAGGPRLPKPEPLPMPNLGVVALLAISLWENWTFAAAILPDGA